MITDPITACLMPPTSSAEAKESSDISVVKKPMYIASVPRLKTVAKIEITGISNNAIPVKANPVAKLFLATTVPPLDKEKRKLVESESRIKRTTNASLPLNPVN